MRKILARHRGRCDCSARVARLEATVADWDAVFSALAPAYARIPVARKRSRLKAVTGTIAAIIIAAGVLSAAAFHSPRHAPAPAWRRTVARCDHHHRHRFETVARISA